MRRVNWNRIVTFVLVWLLIIVLAGTAYGQTAADPLDRSPTAPAWHDPGISPGEPPFSMSYQGFLANVSGVPLSGNYNLTAALYDEPAGGALVWGPETFNNVPVSKGLFNVVLGATVALMPGDFDRALYLEITVNGSALPRQPLRSTAYAYGLLPGAHIVGDAPGGYMLTIDSGPHIVYGGLYIQTTELPIYADVTDEGDEAFVSPDYVRARGYRSRDGSYLFAPAMSGVDCDPNAPNLNVKWDESGTAYLSSATTGAAEFCIPVQMPAVSYGIGVKVNEITVYYRVTSANNYIDGVGMFRGRGALNSDLVLGDSTDLMDTVSSSRSYPVNVSLNDESGPLIVQFLLHFSNTSPADKIYIGGVRLHLDHTGHGYPQSAEKE